ncbi:MAG TPA: IMP cyclohydrolase [Clostridia bacterium]|nr:IMP cyclohydrolase [Clostridia bacterium]
MTDLKKYLESNTYHGRGIIIGLTPSGKAAVAYFIMGRSLNSRNRVFEKEGENVTIYPFDAAKVSDPSLIIYYPIKKVNNTVVVTNGDQTDTVCDYLVKGDKNAFVNALNTRCFEPDSPNFTPRISAIFDLDENFRYSLSVLKSEGQGEKCFRFCFDYEGIIGTGHFIHTYMSDGNPLPSFTGEPVAVNIEDDIDTFTSLIWENLNNDNKISLVVKFFDLANKTFQTRIINKNIK